MPQAKEARNPQKLEEARKVLPGAFRGSMAQPTPCFQSSSSRTEENRFLLFEETKFVVI